MARVIIIIGDMDGTQVVTAGGYTPVSIQYEGDPPFDPHADDLTAAQRVGLKMLTAIIQDPGSDVMPLVGEGDMKT